MGERLLPATGRLLLRHNRRYGGFLVHVGILMAVLSNVLMSSIVATEPRWIFLVGVLPAFLVFWIRRAVPEGLQSEVVFVHDLALPATVTPRNEDGEVADFRLLSPDKVLDLIEQPSGDQAMTVDASLVTLDWLERNGFVKLPDSASARAIYRTGGWT